jgi:hypothetical protein
MAEHILEGKFGHPPLLRQKMQKSKPDLQIWILRIISWQEWQVRNQTFDKELEKVNIQEIREILDEVSD